MQVGRSCLIDAVAKLFKVAPGRACAWHVEPAETVGGDVAVGQRVWSGLPVVAGARMSTAVPIASACPAIAEEVVEGAAKAATPWVSSTAETSAISSAFSQALECGRGLGEVGLAYQLHASVIEVVIELSSGIVLTVFERRGCHVDEVR